MRELPQPHSFQAARLCPVILDYSVDLFDVYSGIMGDIPTTRYRERVIGESHESTETLANTKTLSFVSSGSLTTPSLSNASRLWSFGGRPSGIPNFFGLDNPVTGCQLGSILEASPSCVCQV